MIDHLSQKCEMIVQSCDQYADVWPLFFSSLKNNWPQCPLTINLNSEASLPARSLDHWANSNLELELSKIEPSSSTSSWGARFIKLLKHIQVDYVLVLFDDFILEAPVNIEKLNFYLDIMEKDHNVSVIYFNYIANSFNKSSVYENLEVIGKRADYRLNSAPALWRKNKLLQFTGIIDSPWAWEVFGSYRTFHDTTDFLTVNKSAEDVIVYNYSLGGAIRRGKWVKHVAQPLAQRYQVKIDFAQRGFAPEHLKDGAYTLSWKLKFFWLGWQMIGLRVLIYPLRILLSRYLGRKF